MRNNITDYLLLLLLALIWSSSFLLIKIAVDTIPPFTLTAFRLVLAAALFAIYLWIRGEWIPLHPRALALYFGSGILGHSLPFALISWGETHISSSLTAILMGIMPITTFVLAHLLIAEEPMTRRKACGVFLGFSGLVAVVGLSALSSLGEHVPGQLLVLGGALSYACATIFVRLQPGFEGYKMAAGTLFVAAMLSTVVAGLFEDVGDIDPDLPGVLAAIALAVLPTALAALIYFRLIRNLGATVFSQINYLIPVAGGLWGVLLLNETLHWNVLVALVLVLAGIYLIQSRSAG